MQRFSPEILTAFIEKFLLARVLKIQYFVQKKGIKLITSEIFVLHLTLPYRTEINIKESGKVRIINCIAVGENGSHEK